MKKREGFELDEKKKKIIIFSGILIMVLVTAYFNFFSYKKCGDITCFNTNLARCSKAKFTNVAEDSSWLYVIKGSSKGRCEVYVKSIDINIDDASGIEGKDMVCYMPKGIVMPPESDIDECHGLLKEAMQDLIIKQLHVYIVQNIGQIKESITATE